MEALVRQEFCGVRDPTCWPDQRIVTGSINCSNCVAWVQTLNAPRRRSFREVSLPGMNEWMLPSLTAHRQRSNSTEAYQYEAWIAGRFLTRPFLPKPRRWSLSSGARRLPVMQMQLLNVARLSMEIHPFLTIFMQAQACSCTPFDFCGWWMDMASTNVQHQLSRVFWNWSEYGASASPVGAAPDKHLHFLSRKAMWGVAVGSGW